MEGNNISVHTTLEQATIFEGVVASPPSASAKYLLAKARNDWASIISMWKPNDLPMRSLSDCINRLQIGTDVITFLSPDAVEPIYQWLVRKGVSTPVIWYPSATEYYNDVRYNMGLKVVYVADEEDAAILGMRARVVSPATAWSV
jgi:hypothetical protein